MELRREEIVHGREVDFFLTGPNVIMRLDAFRGEAIGAKLIIEDFDALIQLGDWLTLHGT